MIDSTRSQKIRQADDDGLDAQNKFTSDLTRLPSLRGQEATAQDFMTRAYRDRGLSVDRWKIEVEDIQDLPGFSPVAVSYDDAWNVVGAYRPKNPTGKSLKIGRASCREKGENT